ncbi:MAG TPA: hypothetical protein VNM91_12055 [Dehalococcoidia bacterium]|nr:hypothetical protein [Dehalococcoidia bacterium]
MPNVVVFDFQEPRQKLMAWFLADSGIPCERVETLDDALDALSARPPLLIVNSTADPEEITEVVKTVRMAADWDLRILVLHDGRHREDETPIPADLCLHDVRDVDTLLEVVRAALADDVPAAEPHEAAAEVAGD